MVDYIKLGSGVEMDDNLANELCNCLEKDGIIALPTDTIYGLACDIKSFRGLTSIYEIKNRGFDKPLSICVNSIRDVYKYADVNISKDILETLLPGCYTLIFKKSINIPKYLNPNTDTIGIRFIYNNDISKILSNLDSGCIVLSSANLSNKGNSIKTDDFFEIWNNLSYILDRGELDLDGDSSTIIDFSDKNNINILRKGKGYNYLLHMLDNYGINVR